MLLILVLVLSACQNGGVEQTTKETDQKEQTGVDMNEKELAIIWKPYSTAYVSCADFAEAMGWEYARDADSFMFQEYEMQLDFTVGSLYITRQEEIVDVLPQVPILEDQALYLPADWLEENFGDAIERLDDRIVIVDAEAISLYDIAVYFPDDLIMALAHPELDESKRVMAAIELPRSMGIEIPRLDPKRMMNTRPVRKYVAEFADELKAHGFSDEEIDSISYGEYEVIHAHWLLSEEMQELAVKYYPEYSLEDVSRWTYDELNQRQMADVDQAKRDRFSEVEWKALQERDVKEADLAYLLKEFQQPSTIVDQPDESLKRVLKGYYEDDIAYWEKMNTSVDGKK